ncbi:MAG: TrkA family potassium uptake protein [Proteobacteria bacterium]|nr:TrkA family potassium uptake protein [Pseudomonadota bacterium]
MRRSKFVLVGLGNIGLELLRRLPREVDLVCVDLSPEAIAAARELRGEGIRVVSGDATSRLVLEEAGIDDADAVLLTTTTQKISVEVARVLTDHFHARRVISVGITARGIEDLSALGVEVENIFDLSANALRNRLEQRTKAAHGIGLDKDEILEVEVHPHSRLANKPLRLLTPQRWNVGLIYREGKILVPHGGAVLRGKDRVVLLGEPRVLKTVAEMLTFSFQQFPLEYGPTLTAYLFGDEDQGFFTELAYAFSSFPLERTVLLLSSKARRRGEETTELARQAGLRVDETVPSGDVPLAAIAERLAGHGEERGIVALSRRSVMESAVPFGLDLRRKRFLRGLSGASGCPILLASGTFPYAHVAVPCVEGIDLQHVLETAFEMGTALQQETAALFVKPSKHLSTEEDEGSFREMQKTISDMGLIYKTKVESRLLEGNPVLAVAAALPEYSLLLADTGGWKRQGWLRGLLEPDPVWHIVRRSPISTLLVPPVEEAL